MKLDYLKKKKELVSVALLVVSAILAVVVTAKVIGFFMVPARAENIIRRAVEMKDADPAEKEKSFAKSKEIADDLKRENLFAPPAPKEHPVKTVPAILGDEVQINGQWYGVGDTVGGAKIVAIGPTEVKIEWEGTERTFRPIDAASSEPPGRSTARAGAPGGERADMVVVQSEAGRPGRDGRSSGPGGGQRGGFEAMRDRFQNMSERDRERVVAEMRERRERYMNMSPAEQERVRNEMRERFGGGGGPSGGRGPGGGGGPGGGRGRGGR